MCIIFTYWENLRKRQKGGLVLAKKISKEEQDIKNREYQKMTQKIKPRRPILRNVLVAFLVGGLICAIGQVILSFFIGQGMPPKEANVPTIAIMVFLGAFLTGVGVYDELGKFAGAGSAIPITGFANSMVSPAIEFKREGWVLGLGAKMFTIAGPVIAYGSIAAIIIALVSLLFK